MWTNVFIVIAVIVSCGLSLGIETSVLINETTQWCSYIRDTFEPSVLVYNRIPKCGSSTMLTIFKILGKSVDLVDLGEENWGDYSDDEARLAELRSKVLSKGSSVPRVVVGHITYRTFQSALNNFSDVEYMQIFRECESRYTSHWWYDLEYSNVAYKQRQQGAIGKYHKSMLGTKHTIECILNQSCLRQAALTRRMRSNIIEHYLAPKTCGPSCSADKRFQSFQRSVDFNARRGAYITFGLVEHIDKYLEMLECVYPTAFKGVLKKYLKSGGISANSRSYSYSKEVMNAVKSMSQSVCNASSDPLIYDKLLSPRFWDRYNTMKASPDKCCRSRNKRSAKQTKNVEGSATWISNFLSQFDS